MPYTEQAATVSEMPTPVERRSRVVERLAELIDRRAGSVLALEGRLGRGRAYVSDALAGRKRLTIELVLEVLEELGLPDSAFFRSDNADPMGRDEVAEPVEPYRLNAKRQQYPWAPEDLLTRWARAEQLADFALREQYEIDRLLDQHRRRALEQQRKPD